MTADWHIHSVRTMVMDTNQDKSMLTAVGQVACIQAYASQVISVSRPVRETAKIEY
jgi:hypothetical protein